MIGLRNKIGQMLIVGFTGCVLDANSEIVQCLSNEGLGGVLLFDKDLHLNQFGKNLQNITQIKQLTAFLQQTALSNTAVNIEKLPLFIALDYEGGAVDRLSKIPGCMQTLSALEMAALSESDRIAAFSKMAYTLKNLGFNLNFAPVVDLHLQQDQGIIGKLKRSFSEHPEVVVKLARQFVEVFSQQGIACCYKHFPGHGSALGDTHEGFVEVTHSFDAAELIPYQRLLQENNNPLMVMTAHVVNKQLDSTGLPATLSPTILTGLLRNRLGFEGVIVSDDLQMQAIAHHYSLEEALCLTINAGADMIIIANQLGNNSLLQLIDCIEQLVIDKKIDPQRIEKAYTRVLHLKSQVQAVKYPTIEPI